MRLRGAALGVLSLVCLGSLAPHAWSEACFFVARTVTLRDDSPQDGRFDTAAILFNMEIDPASLPAPGLFRLTVGGQVVTGTVLTLDDPRTLTVRYPAVPPGTSLAGVSFDFDPDTASMTSAAGVPFCPPPAGSPPTLIDGAGPSLLTVQGRDTDGDGQFDSLDLLFTEPVHFAAGAGTWLSGITPADVGFPSVDTGSSPAILEVLVDGLATSVPLDPGFTIVGGGNIATILQLALNQQGAATVNPGLQNATVRYDFGARRFVIRSGSVPPAASSFEISSVTPNLAGLRLTPEQGGEAIAARAADVPEIADFMVRRVGGENLLRGITDEGHGVVVEGDVVTVRLTHGISSTAMPAVLFVDNFNGTSLVDAAGNASASVVTNLEDVGATQVLASGGMLRIRDNDENPFDGLVSMCPPGTAADLDLATSFFPAELVERVDATFENGPPVTGIEVLVPAGASGDGFVHPPETVEGVGTSLSNSSVQFVGAQPGIYPVWYRAILKDEPVAPNLYTSVATFGELGERHFAERRFLVDYLQDTLPPSLTVARQTITTLVPSAAAVGAVVDVIAEAGAVTSDNCDPSPSLTRDGPATFPVGPTDVTLTATDRSGNTSEVLVTVAVAYGFGGFRPPIGSDGASLFKSGRVIPIKFTLSASDGSLITSAAATLEVLKVTDSVTGTAEQVTPEGTAASAGTAFRVDPSSGQYIYNLSTHGYAVGTYLLRARLDDMTDHDAIVSIRR